MQSKGTWVTNQIVKLHVGGRLWEVVTHAHHYILGPKLCLVNIWQLQRLTACFKCSIHMKSEFLPETLVCYIA